MVNWRDAFLVAGAALLASFVVLTLLMFVMHGMSALLRKTPELKVASEPAKAPKTAAEMPTSVVPKA